MRSLCYTMNCEMVGKGMAMKRMRVRPNGLQLISTNLAFLYAFIRLLHHDWLSDLTIQTSLYTSLDFHGNSLASGGHFGFFFEGASF